MDRWLLPLSLFFTPTEHPLPSPRHSIQHYHSRFVRISPPPPPPPLSLTYHSIPTPKSNHDKRKLDRLLPHILSFFRSFYGSESQGEGKGGEGGGEEGKGEGENGKGGKGCGRIIIHSDDGADTPVCVCVAVLVKFFDVAEEEGGAVGGCHHRRGSEREKKDLTKHLVRRMFMNTMRYYPQARPPQVMMKMITRYFLSPAIYQHWMMCLNYVVKVWPNGVTQACLNHVWLSDVMG